MLTDDDVATRVADYFGWLDDQLDRTGSGQWAAEASVTTPRPRSRMLLGAVAATLVVVLLGGLVWSMGWRDSESPAVVPVDSGVPRTTLPDDSAVTSGSVLPDPPVDGMPADAVLRASVDTDIGVFKIYDYAATEMIWVVVDGDAEPINGSRVVAEHSAAEIEDGAWGVFGEVPDRFAYGLVPPDSNGYDVVAGDVTVSPDASGFWWTWLPADVESFTITGPRGTVAVDLTVESAATTTTAVTVPGERAPTSGSIDRLAIGDQVMLGAAPSLAEEGFVVDAVVSRQFHEVNYLVDEMVRRRQLDDASVVVLHLGTNGTVMSDDLDAVLDALATVPQVILVTSTADRDWTAPNTELFRQAAAAHPNVELLDWGALVADCEGDCLFEDGIHLTPDGNRYYTQVVADAATDPRFHRPEIIESGDVVTARIIPAANVALANSSVGFQIVEAADGRFLQADLGEAVPPDGAEFWTLSINGRLRTQTTARQGSLLGTRIDPEVYGDSFTVSLNAITGDEVLASTGDVPMTD